MNSHSCNCYTDHCKFSISYKIALALALALANVCLTGETYGSGPGMKVFKGMNCLNKQSNRAGLTTTTTKTCQSRVPIFLITRWMSGFKRKVPCSMFSQHLDVNIGKWKRSIASYPSFNFKPKCLECVAKTKINIKNGDLTVYYYFRCYSYEAPPHT